MANLACIDSGNAHGRFLQYNQKDFYRVQIRQHGDAVLNRATADHSAVLVVNAGQDRPGVDDIAHISGPNGFQYFFTTVRLHRRACRSALPLPPAVHQGKGRSWSVPPPA